MLKDGDMIAIYEHASSLATWAPPAVISRSSSSRLPFLTGRAKKPLQQPRALSQRRSDKCASSIQFVKRDRWRPSSSLIWEFAPKDNLG